MKKWYRKAVLSVHPDKVGTSFLEKSINSPKLISLHFSLQSFREFVVSSQHSFENINSCLFVWNELPEYVGRKLTRLTAVMEVNLSKVILPADQIMIYFMWTVNCVTFTYTNVLLMWSDAWLSIPVSMWEALSNLN